MKYFIIEQSSISVKYFKINDKRGRSTVLGFSDKCQAVKFYRFLLSFRSARGRWPILDGSKGKCVEVATVNSLSNIYSEEIYDNVKIVDGGNSQLADFLKRGMSVGLCKTFRYDESLGKCNLSIRIYNEVSHSSITRGFLDDIYRK